MCRTKWLLVTLFIALTGNQIAPANPPAAPSVTAALICPKLPPLWHGFLCLVAGRYDKTITVCNKLLRDDPENQYAYALRGYAHLLKRDNARQAIADFTEVLERDPGNAAIYVARAQVFDQTKEYDRTIADCNEAIRLDPRSSVAYATRGECYAWMKAMGKAIADYNAALRIDPGFAWARAKRAYAYLLRGEGSRALADFDELLRQLPGNREVLNGVCSVYLFNYRDYDRAVAKASELIRSDPREARWYWLRCMAYLAKGEHIPSCCDAVIAVILNPRTIKIRISRHSWTVAFLPASIPSFNSPVDNDDEERIESCTKRLHSDQWNLAAYYERAYAYIAKRNYKDAIADLDEIIRLDSSDAEVYRMRGRLHTDLERYPEAVDDYAVAMRLDPGNADDYAGRARAYAAMGKFEESLCDCKKSVALDPRFVLPHTIRGWVQLNQKKFDRAIAEFSEAIRLSPADPDLYERRAEALWHVRDFAGLIADYKQAVKLAPSNAHACAQLAGYLCSCPDASLRDGKEARRLATFACEATSWRDLECLVNLALACAECGDFDAAIKWETEAGKFVPDSIKQYHQHRLELYRAHKTYHATPPP